MDQHESKLHSPENSVLNQPRLTAFHQNLFTSFGNRL